MNQQQKISLRIALLEQIQTLVTAGLGLVAALAWNTAIQDLFKMLFPDQHSLTAKFLYALFITAIIVLLTQQLNSRIGSLKSNIK